MTSSEAPLSAPRRRRSRRRRGGGVGDRLIALGSLVALASVGSIGVFTTPGSAPGPAPDGEEAPLPPPPDEQLAAVALVGPPELVERPDGLPGLARVYGLDLSSDLEVVASSDQVVAALHDGRAVLGAVPAVSASLPATGLVGLEDDLGMSAGQRIVAVTAGETRAEDAPDLGAARTVLDVTVGMLVPAALREARAAIEDGRDLDEVARGLLADPPAEPAPEAGAAARIRVAGVDGELGYLLTAVAVAALAQTGATVEVVPTGGTDASAALTAIAQGDADASLVVVGELPEAADLGWAAAPADALRRLQERLGDEVHLGQRWSPGEVGLRYLVTEDVAARFGLARLSDLIGVAPEAPPVEVGAPRPSPDR